MAYYRLYLMNVETQIDRFHEFDTVDDEAAIGRAEMFRSRRAMELWAGARLVRRWPLLTVVPKD